LDYVGQIDAKAVLTLRGSKPAHEPGVRPGYPEDRGISKEGS